MVCLDLPVDLLVKPYFFSEHFQKIEEIPNFYGIICDFSM